MVLQEWISAGTGMTLLRYAQLLLMECIFLLMAEALSPIRSTGCPHAWCRIRKTPMRCIWQRVITPLFTLEVFIARMIQASHGILSPAQGFLHRMIWDTRVLQCILFSITS